MTDDKPLPLERITLALESIAGSLERMANPLLKADPEQDDVITLARAIRATEGPMIDIHKRRFSPADHLTLSKGSTP